MKSVFGPMKDRKNNITSYACMLAALAATLSGVAMAQGGGNTDWSAVTGNLGGWQGEAQPDGVLKVDLVSPSMNVNISGKQVKAPLVAHGYVAFSAVSGTTSGANGTTTANALVTGEVPVPEAQVSTVLTMFARQGLTSPAVHKHVLSEQPRTVFVHFEEAGEAVSIARRIYYALVSSGLNLQEEPKQAASQAQNLDVNAIAGTLGAAAPLSAQGANPSGLEPIKLESTNGILVVSMPRAEQFTNCGAAVFNARQSAAAAASGSTAATPATAGAGNNRGTAAVASLACQSAALSAQATAAGSTGASDASSASTNYVSPLAIGAAYEFRFQGTGGGNAIVTAELPLLPTEVRDTQRIIADASGGTAQFMFGEVHNHAKDESPRLIFMHVTAVGNTAQISEVFRAAIANNANVAAGQQSIVNWPADQR